MTDAVATHHDGGSPLRTVVLISGGGSNLAALLDACARPDYPVRVVAVGSDRPDAGGLAIASRAGLATFVEPLSAHPTRVDWDRALAERVAAHRPDLVVSAGFRKLLGPAFLRAFAGRVLNTHNSLLPAFAGTNGPGDALAYGVKIAGATVFMVDEGVDTGPIVAQAAVDVRPGDTVDTLTERIKIAERAQLVDTVRQMALHGWTISGRTVTIP